jgi:hypothetical protein
MHSSDRVEPVICSIVPCVQSSTQVAKICTSAGSQLGGVAVAQPMMAESSAPQPRIAGCELGEPRTHVLAIADAASVPDEGSPVSSMKSSSA